MYTFHKNAIDIKRLSNTKLYRFLSLFSKPQLRKLAKAHNIPLGITKECTLFNLICNRKKLGNLTGHVRINEYDDSGDSK